MNCREVKKRISAYLDKETSFAETENIQKHLEMCNDCRKEMDEISQMYSLLGLWTLEGTAPDLTFVRPLDKKPGKSVFAFDDRFFKWAALAVFGMGAFIGISTGLFLYMETENARKIDAISDDTLYARNWGMGALEDFPPDSIENVYLFMTSKLDSERK
jgi:hypothetical protein